MAIAGDVEIESPLHLINTQDRILPVLIVGAGPVGIVLLILLTKLGVKCAVLEKRKDFSRHPQAHFIHDRSMEVFSYFFCLSNLVGAIVKIRDSRT